MTDLQQTNILTAEAVAQAVEQGIAHCATTLRKDACEAIEQAILHENTSLARTVLSQITENADIAARDCVPICQDTGTVWVHLEVGHDVAIPGNVLISIDEAVERAYKNNHLRMSVVRDALFNRVNTENNTPAFSEISLCPGCGATVHVMLKGGGSDNASRVVMLSPGAGVEGVCQEVLTCVQEKAANACPPLIIGVGVGATFDKVAGLAKKALLRPIGSPANSPEAASFEKTLLDKINATNIGPAALGGKTTALALHLETAPCHIAALPVAINMGCCAMRSVSIDIIPWNKKGGDR